MSNVFDSGWKNQKGAFCKYWGVAWFRFELIKCVIRRVSVCSISCHGRSH